MNYLIFGGEDYYANAGIYGLIETWKDKEKCIERAKSLIGKYIQHKDWDGKYSEYSPYQRIEWVQVIEVGEGNPSLIFSLGRPYGLYGIPENKRVVDNIEE